MSYAKRYVETQDQTASRERILVMLLEGALRFMRQGGLALDQGDRATAARAVGRALDIVLELRATLDPKHAPELTERLSDVYAFVGGRLLVAQATGSPEALAEAERTFRPVAEAFGKVVGNGSGLPTDGGAKP